MAWVLVLLPSVRGITALGLRVLCCRIRKPHDLEADQVEMQKREHCCCYFLDHTGTPLLWADSQLPTVVSEASMSKPCQSPEAFRTTLCSPLWASHTIPCAHCGQDRGRQMQAWLSVLVSPLAIPGTPRPCCPGREGVSFSSTRLPVWLVKIQVEARQGYSTEMFPGHPGAPVCTYASDPGWSPSLRRKGQFYFPGSPS